MTHYRLQSLRLTGKGEWIHKLTVFNAGLSLMGHWLNCSTAWRDSFDGVHTECVWSTEVPVLARYFRTRLCLGKGGLGFDLALGPFLSLMTLMYVCNWFDYLWPTFMAESRDNVSAD